MKEIDIRKDQFKEAEEEKEKVVVVVGGGKREEPTSPSQPAGS